LEEGLDRMKRRRKKMLVSLNYIIILNMLILLSIATSRSSFGIDVFQAERGVNARVVSNDKAFVGIIHDEVYKVVYPNESKHISLWIKNNLPYKAAYELVLSGLLIKDFEPGSFSLYPDEEQLIEIKLLDLEEMLDLSKLLDLNEANERSFDIEGYISAEFDDGSINAKFRFEVIVELPKELVESKILHDETNKKSEEDINEADVNKENAIEGDVIERDVVEEDANKEDVIEVDENNEKTTEMETINDKNLPGETENQSNSNELMIDLTGKTGVDNANDEITENILTNIIKDENIESKTIASDDNVNECRN